MGLFWLTGRSCSAERATHHGHLRTEEQGDGLPGPDPGSEARKPQSFHRWEIWIFYEKRITGLLLNNPRIALYITNVLSKILTVLSNQTYNQRFFRKNCKNFHSYRSHIEEMLSKHIFPSIQPHIKFKSFVSSQSEVPQCIITFVSYSHSVTVRRCMKTCTTLVIIIRKLFIWNTLISYFPFGFTKGVRFSSFFASEQYLTEAFTRFARWNGAESFYASRV